jgi:hypothetical protein
MSKTESLSVFATWYTPHGEKEVLLQLQLTFYYDIRKELSIFGYCRLKVSGKIYKLIEVVSTCCKLATFTTRHPLRSAKLHTP